MAPTLKSITANLMVRDVNKTVNYYKDILGFNLEMSVPGKGDKLQWAMITRDSVELMFHEEGNFLEEVPQLKGSTMGGSLTLFIEIESFNELYDSVSQHEDVEFIKEPYTTFYGMKEFTIRDLNGYILTFAEPQE
ncbi:MAG: VOC family protein [Balneolaceae bacterium]|nr:VOC family protein [Balneolaceae bacterium]